MSLDDLGDLIAGQFMNCDVGVEGLHLWERGRRGVLSGPLVLGVMGTLPNTLPVEAFGPTHPETTLQS
jgi:hypothetical protein